MNTVKVQFEIHDVVNEQPKKVKLTRRKIEQTRPQTAPNAPSSPNNPILVKQKSIGLISGNQYSNANQSQPAKKPNDQQEDFDKPHLASPLPMKAPTSHIVRRNPNFHSNQNKPDWNMSLTVPDRDFLIIEQDVKVAEFRSKHEYFEEKGAGPPQPELTESIVRKTKKHLTSEEHRDRLEHHSFGCVANNPLPFYPQLKGDTGIHGNRWNVGSKLPIDYEDWAKPLPKPDKTREVFYKEYRIKETPVPLKDIDIQHSIASVESTYTKARQLQHGLKKKPPT